MSAGWIWHPWSAVVWFDVAAALADPTLLDAHDGSPQGSDASVEECSAAWLDDDRIVIGGPDGLTSYDIPSRAYVHRVDLGYPPGTMMPAGPHHVVTFFGRPRLVSLATGEIVHEWSDLDSGKAVTSIVRRLPCPPLALDPARPRFAVANHQDIDVVAIDVAALARR